MTSASREPADPRDRSGALARRRASPLLLWPHEDSREERKERLVAMVVLVRVHDGWAVKWAFKFSDEPKGTSEGMIMHVIEKLRH